MARILTGSVVPSWAVSCCGLGFVSLLDYIASPLRVTYPYAIISQPCCDTATLILRDPRNQKEKRHGPRGRRKARMKAEKRKYPLPMCCKGCSAKSGCRRAGRLSLTKSVKAAMTRPSRPPRGGERGGGGPGETLAHFSHSASLPGSVPGATDLKQGVLVSSRFLGLCGAPQLRYR